MAIAVVIPGRFGDPRFGGRGSSDRRPAAQIYARRRLAALLVVLATTLVLLLGTGHVVANRGGAPASTSMIRPESPSAGAAADHVYIVQAGDTLWSIGQRFHGHTALADYVDALVEANGGTRLQISQALSLP